LAKILNLQLFQKVFLQVKRKILIEVKCKFKKNAHGARNFTQCDSLLIGDKCGAHTIPYINQHTPTARVEHEATTSKISEDQLFYCLQRGLDTEQATSLIVNGFCKEVMKELPMEFAVEAQKLIGISLEGSVG
jgi:Fe-S cluster assembly protein SufB